jgi:hypothetical protein
MSVMPGSPQTTAIQRDQPSPVPFGGLRTIAAGMDDE